VNDQEDNKAALAELTKLAMTKTKLKIFNITHPSNLKARNPHNLTSPTNEPSVVPDVSRTNW
jgi:hypothetical protein